MSNSTALITEMGVLVGIFLLGLLAKLFPRRTGNRNQRTGISDRQSSWCATLWLRDCLFGTLSTAVNHQPRIQPLL